MKVPVGARKNVAALVLSLGVTLAAGGLAQGSDVSDAASERIPGGFASWGDFFEVQDDLDLLADKVHAEDLRAGGHGYGSAVVSAENRQIELYWKGSPPKNISSILEKAPRNLSVKILPASYSMTEMQRAAHQMASQPSVGKSRIVRAYPKADASGLQVAVAGDRHEIQKLQAVRNTRIPISYSAETAFTPASDRQNDSAPYKGGAAWYSGGLCSTGFGVTVSGKPMMLSAAHCSVMGGNVRFGSLSNPVVGTVVQQAPSLDLALLDVASTPRIYRHMPVSPWSSPVRATTGTHVGDVICTGGSKSGENCNIKVLAVEISEDGLDHMAAAHHIQDKTAVARGDSGGPVFTPCAVGECTGVTAKGIISQSGGGVPCKPGLPPGTQCSSVVGFQPLKFVFAAFNATVTLDNS
ncbi:S1 family peptidase [Streptomyces sp. NPDC015127]|uniref:S1 family peptidase n=1 Tax=Streptomyces sp. NPDC015127 TaxID=3364939 RepID=UPI0036FDF5CE